MLRSLRLSGLAIALGFLIVGTGGPALAMKPVGQEPAESVVELPDREHFHLFVLAGQSNMAGRGKVSEEDKTPHPRVLMFNKEGQWVPAVDPIHFDKPKVVGTGLGKTFAIEYAEAHPGVTVGLIPCAVGGTPIAKWTPGTFDPVTKTHPLDDCLARAQAALPAGTLKGILWHQGEGDTSSTAAPLYADNLQELVLLFRREFNAPDVPFILGQLGQFKPNPSEGFFIVGEAHKNLPSRLPNCAYVNSDGLGHIGDNTHFHAEALRELGRRYYAAYEQLMRKSNLAAMGYGGYCHPVPCQCVSGIPEPASQQRRRVLRRKCVDSPIRPRRRGLW